MILDPETKKTHKLCQELVDSTFKYLHFVRAGTPLQKTNSKKKLLGAIDELSSHLGQCKVETIKPTKRVTTYRKRAEVIHLIR